MDRIDEKIEQGNLKRQLRKLWSEVQRYSGLEYAFDQRVVVQVYADTLLTLILLIAVFGAVLTFFVGMVFASIESNVVAIVSAAIFVACIVTALVSYRYYANVPADKVWTLSYQCKKAEFLEWRLASIYEWQEETKPLLDKFLRLRPIIVGELGLNFMLFGYDDLKTFYIACDLFKGNYQIYPCTQKKYEELVFKITKEREKRRRDKLTPEQRRCEAEHVIEQFEASLDKKGGFGE